MKTHTIGINLFASGSGLTVVATIVVTLTVAFQEFVERSMSSARRVLRESEVCRTI
jgi:hypothetical protein